MSTALLRITGLVTAMVFAASAIVSAQAAAVQTPAAAAAPPAAAAQPGAPAPPAPETYTYNPDGRRDPFVSLVARGTESTGGKRTEGLSGLSANDIVVRGLLLSKGSYIALVSGPEGKTYTARVNDRLVDGIIRSITPQGLVIMQEVNDPLSLIKQREVRKGLRASEDGK
ncbi:MAG: pilus assembly protein PilP [Vicinamibacterales bacterium]|nr:pilus assembly protein PilP [Vicinamibacterales bacterium]